MKLLKIIAFSTCLFMIGGCAAAPAPAANTTVAPETEPVTTEAEIKPDKMIALTFDDGPSTKTMVEVLDLLKQYDAKATFFVIGRKINANTQPVLQRAVDEGHEIANHPMNHQKTAELTDEEIRAEFEDCQKAVLDAVGVEMYYFRAPYGSIDDRMYEIIQAPFMGAAISTGDGTIGSLAADRAWRATSNAYDGAIVLFHCFQGNDETVTALETVLPELKAQGYEFVTLTELYTRNGGEVPVATPGIKFKDNKPLE